MRLSEINIIIEACEILVKYAGRDVKYWLGKIVFLEEGDIVVILQTALKKRLEFYSLPIKERLERAGFKKDKNGNMSKTIEL